MDSDSASTLVHAFVTTRVDYRYCNAILAGSTKATELCTLVADVASRRQLRSASQNVLLVPRYKLSGLGRRAFRVAGPLVWNSIANFLRDPALELASFKRQLKTFLLARY